MIFTEAAPVTFDHAMEPEVDVVIIGAGVIGISTAWHLAKAGIRTLVCEKGRVAGEQSCRNWGWVRQQGRDEAELPIMMESNAIWASLAAEIGEDLGFRQHGVIYTAETESEMSKHHQWVKLAASYGLESKILSAVEIRQRVKGMEGNWLGGVVTESDGRAEPFVAVPALARDCARRGVAIIENCAVRSLEFSAGRVSSVVTERGEVKCHSVICAGGAWSSIFLANVGFRFPQLTVRSTVARTAVAPDFYRGNTSCSDLAIRRREDGGYTIAPCFNEHLINFDSFRFMPEFTPALTDVWSDMKTRVLNPPPAKSTLVALKQRYDKRMPGLRGVAIEQSWAGMIDATPDVVPVMDQLENFPGLFLASGFSGHGFGIGPAVGRIMADMVLGRELGHDMKRFRSSRFSDGSKLPRGPSL